MPVDWEAVFHVFIMVGVVLLFIPSGQSQARLSVTSSAT
jgi:uncharacterized membrane protein